MGTDVVVACVRETPDFGRATLRKMIVDLWRGRGAKPGPTRWSRAAADRCWGEDDAVIGYALSPTSRGWIAVLESANASVRMDKELLSLLGARTTCWVSWACDHSSLYGAQRISKARTDEPVDLEYGQEPYDRLADSEGWEFLVFSGAAWNQYNDFAINARTKKHALPKRATLEGDPKTFVDAVRKLEVDAALAALASLREVDDDMLDAVFSTAYRVEFEEVASCVLRVGSALVERCAEPARGGASMSAERWARLLETAAICSDEAIAKRAVDALAKASRAKAAIAEVRARFGEAAVVKRSSGDGRAAMVPAGKRFVRWTKSFA